MSPIDLTDEQRAAVEHPLAPLLIVAGAGTGKTTVMTERIAHLIASNQVEPNHILGLTFTNKAAAELKGRVQARLQRDADVTVATYHGFASNLVSNHALELDLHPRTRLLNRPQAWQLLFTVFDEFRFDKRSSLMPGMLVDAALGLASRCANYLVDIDEVVQDSDRLLAEAKYVMTESQWKKLRESARGRRELCQIVAAYGARKRERRLIDFDDQIRLAVTLLRDHPGVAAALYDQHPVVLLDEYQDTNFAQREMLKAIYRPGSAVTAVGDDMQSIYAFRGAHIENILHFEQDFTVGPTATGRAVLTENRRSGSEVVRLANLIQQQVDQNRTIERELRALPGADPTPITCFLAADERAEATAIAEQIKAAGAPWHQRAVLCRKRRVIPAIAAALEEAGIPVEVVGTSGLLDRPEIIDLVAWLQLLADPAASVALLRVLEGPRYRIGFRDLAALSRHARHLASPPEGKAVDEHHIATDLSDALSDLSAVTDISVEARTRLEAFVAERRRFEIAARRLPVLELCELVAESTGLWGATDGRGRENLLRFLDIAEQFSPVDGDDTSLLAFVEYLRLIDDSDEDVPESHAGGADSVRVMTIHQAKGLEWDMVWVPGLTVGVFPEKRLENPMGKAELLPWWVVPDTDLPPPETISKPALVEGELRRRQDDDEWRLLYVASTRARKALTLTASQWYSGATKPQGQSPFYDFLSAQPGLVDELFHHDPAIEDPAVAARRRLADDLASRESTVRSTPTAASRAESEGRLFSDESPVTLSTIPPAVLPAPVALSVSNLVSYARCHRQMYWSVVRPLPTVTSGAASIGTEVHRWIELGGPAAIREPDPDQTDADAVGDTVVVSTGEAARPSRAEIVTGLQSAFKASPYVDLAPVQVEAPFALAVGGRLVRGRIDAVYRRDGRLELVDFKTGMPPAVGDPSAHTQLDLYAVAAVDTWGASVSELRTTYCYLRRDGTVDLVTSDWDDDRLARARADLEAWLTDLDRPDYSVTVGEWCLRCDFVDACGPGRAFAAASADRADGSQ